MTGPNPSTRAQNVPGGPARPMVLAGAILHSHGDGWVPRGSVRFWWCLNGGLGVAGGIGGTGLDDVVAPRRVPVKDPLPPGVDARHRRQLGPLPWAVIHPHLDRVDALVLRPRDARDLRRPLLQVRVGQAWHVDTRLGLDRRLLGPATLGPVCAFTGPRRHLDVGDPLAGGHVA